MPAIAPPLKREAEDGLELVELPEVLFSGSKICCTAVDVQLDGNIEFLMQNCHPFCRPNFETCLDFATPTIGCSIVLPALVVYTALRAAHICSSIAMRSCRIH